MRNSIFIVSHGPFSLKEGIFHTHGAKATFINDLTDHYDKIFVYTDIVSTVHPDYDLVSQTPINVNKVQVIPFWHVKGAGEEGILRSILKYSKFLLTIFRDRKSWQDLFLFQSFYSILTIALIYLLKLRSRVIVYMAGDISESLIHRVKFKNSLIRKLYGHLINWYEGSVLERSDSILVHGTDLYNRYKDLGSKIDYIVPMRERFQGQQKKKFENIKNFVFVGRLIKSKGVDFLLEAVKEVITKNIPIHLDIVGSGPEDNSLKTYAETLGVFPHVRFCGHISDRKELTDIYANADVFVLPSLTEGFPRVIYESIENGLLIVSTDVGGIPSFIRHKKNGILVPVNELDKLGRTMLDVLNMNRVELEGMVMQASRDLDAFYERSEYASSAQQVSALFEALR